MVTCGKPALEQVKIHIEVKDQKPMIQSGYVCVGGGGACVGVGSEGDNPGVLWVIQGVLIRRCNPSQGTSLDIIASLCKQI